MQRTDFQDFIKFALVNKNETPSFWNVIKLTKGRLDKYSGPRTREDYIKTQQDKYTSSVHKLYDGILFYLYQNLNASETQQCLKWAFAIAPFIIRPCNYDLLFAGTNWVEEECYEHILANINSLTDQKLKYDLLSKIIDRLTYKYKIYAYFDSMPGLNLGAQKIYQQACAMRAGCEYAKQYDMKIRDVRIEDMRVYLRNTLSPENKRTCALEILQLLRADIQDVVQYSQPQHIEQKVKDVCKKAMSVAGEVSAANMDLTEKIWDEFDYKLVIPVAQKVNARYCGR